MEEQTRNTEVQINEEEIFQNMYLIQMSASIKNSHNTIIKKETLLTKIHLVKALIFPVWMDLWM